MLAFESQDYLLLFRNSEGDNIEIRKRESEMKMVMPELISVVKY